MHWHDPIPAELPSAPIVLIGNFDGVHRGHCALLDHARRSGAPVVVLTFEPHPRLVLDPGSAPFRLTTHPAKRQALRDAGADLVLTLRFDAALAAMAAEAFVARILVGTIGARTVLIGEDYRFGRGRAGDRHLLDRLGREAGFDVRALPDVTDRGGHRFSSSLIRQRIGEGRIADANDLLGRRWTMRGLAERIQGGPVAVEFGSLVRPAAGTYAVETRRRGLHARNGSAHVGMGASHLLLPGEWEEGPIEIGFDSRVDIAEAEYAPACLGENFSLCI